MPRNLKELFFHENHGTTDEAIPILIGIVVVCVVISFFIWRTPTSGNRPTAMEPLFWVFCVVFAVGWVAVMSLMDVFLTIGGS